MKNKAPIFILLALVITAGVGVFLWKTQSISNTNQQTKMKAEAPTAEASPSSPKGDTKMANTPYDLTVDAQGLSKATATMTLATGGVVKLKFWTNEAPKTSARIAELIHQGFYNDMSFHRVVPGFVVQGGDPTHTGTGGSGQKLKAEFNSHKHELGVWSMARAQDVDSADSQFFIMLGTHPHLDGSYTGFGKVIEGIEHVQKIKMGDRVTKFVIE